MMAIQPVDFHYIRELVKQRSAIILEPGKEYLVETRLGAVARENGCSNLQELVGRLRTQAPGALHRQVVEAMTTNETSFFRDVAPFDALRQSVVPALLAARAQERRLHIWCGACSTGQEPYSIAMLLREHFPQLTGWHVQILATDLSRDVLDRARTGRYTQLEVNRGLPATYLVRYFQRMGTEWVVREEVRRMIDFRELNLVEAWPAMPAMDLVFLRNVLIYFDVATKRQVLLRVRKLMRPDASLFLGGAETTLNLDTEFYRVQHDRTGFYRLRGE